MRRKIFKKNRQIAETNEVLNFILLLSTKIYIVRLTRKLYPRTTSCVTSTNDLNISIRKWEIGKWKNKCLIIKVNFQFSFFLTFHLKYFIYSFSFAASNKKFFNWFLISNVAKKHVEIATSNTILGSHYCREFSSLGCNSFLWKKVNKLRANRLLINTCGRKLNKESWWYLRHVY